MEGHDARESVRRGFEWLLSFANSFDWTERRRRIEAQLLATTRPLARLPTSDDFRSVSVVDDRIGWYLYLAETWLDRPDSYEPIQGARVLPIFERLGRHIELLDRIGGVREKCLDLLGPQRGGPDGGLFEILTALMYARDGWRSVELIPPSRTGRSPDIRVQSGAAEWFVECKRLVGRSDYSTSERKRWLRLWDPLAKKLLEQRLPLVFEICFHVELVSLPDDFVVNALADKLPLVVPPCTVFENHEWTVRVRPVDMDGIQERLKNSFVKNPSDQLQELIIGCRVRQGGCTTVFLAKGGTVGPPTGTNRFIESIGFAAGAVWDCDAQRSIEIRARDIRSQLANALEQLPARAPSVVHVGLETLDGWAVEKERFERICRTVLSFDARGRSLHWIYCHLFQPYSPPEADWVLDETVYFFRRGEYEGPAPLKRHSLIVPDENARPGVHWKP